MSSEPMTDENSRRRLTKRAITYRQSTSTSTSSTTTAAAATPDSDVGDPRRRSLRHAASIPYRHSAHVPSPVRQTRGPPPDHPLAPNSASHQLPRNNGVRHPRYSLIEKTSADLLGQRFDSAAVLSGLNAVPYSADPPPAQNQVPPAPSSTSPPNADPLRSRPIPSNNSGTGPAFANPAVRLSQSLAATGRKMEDIPPARADMGGLRTARQRYSDEAKENKALKKKSGFSSFFNLSSPRRPAISAPENPVHVTHVGYDTETGEFTVSVMSPTDERSHPLALS